MADPIPDDRSAPGALAWPAQPTVPALPPLPEAARLAEWMGRALEEARAALESDDVPVGAVVVDRDGAVIGVGRNERELREDPTAHAEVVAIRQAAWKLGDWHLTGATLIVTLEPCVMCAGAILAARIPRVIYGAWDEKAGAAGSVYDVLRDRRLNHRVEVVAGVEAEACGELLSAFFRDRPSRASSPGENMLGESPSDQRAPGVSPSDQRAPGESPSDQGAPGEGFSDESSSR